MKLKFASIFFIICLILDLQSCALNISTPSQEVFVRAIDSKTGNVIPTAYCNLSNNKAKVIKLGANPGSATLKRSFGRLIIHCNAKGYIQKAVVVGAKFNPYTLGDAVFLPSAIIDYASGASAKYPSHITVIMKKA